VLDSLFYYNVLMSESSFSRNETAKDQTAAVASKSRKSILLQDITKVFDEQEPTKCNNNKCSSTTGSCYEKIPQSATFFGPHLLPDIKIVRDLEVTKPNLLKRVGDEKLNETLDRIKDRSSASIRGRNNPREVVPFCKQLLTNNQGNQLRSESRSRNPHSHTEAMWKSSPDKGHFNFRKRTSPSFFIQDGINFSNVQQNSRPGMTNKSRQTESQKTSSVTAGQEFGELGLSFDQIVGLESLGFKVSKFLPPWNGLRHRDSHIPPSFDIDNASCYWCETPYHIAYGVAYILRDDAMIVGIEMEWSRRTGNAAVLQLATADTVILIPLRTENPFALKALQVIFRDSWIVKTGVNIEKNLKYLWLRFQIESNSFVELNELLNVSGSQFKSLSTLPKGPITLPVMASLLGFKCWQTQEMRFSDWYSRSLTMKQLRYAARNALVTIRIFWKIILGSRMSKSPNTTEFLIKIRQFVDSVSTRGPISKRHENGQVEPHGFSQELLSHKAQIKTPIGIGHD